MGTKRAKKSEETTDPNGKSLSRVVDDQIEEIERLRGLIREMQAMLDAERASHRAAQMDAERFALELRAAREHPALNDAASALRFAIEEHKRMTQRVGARPHDHKLHSVLK